VDNAAKSAIVNEVVLVRLVPYVTLNRTPTKSRKILYKEDEWKKQDIRECVLMSSKFFRGKYVGIKLTTRVSAIRNSPQHMVTTGNHVLQR
jgi:hypothetical protein